MTSVRVLNNCGGSFDLDTKLDEIAEREQQSEAPNFWDDNTAAQKIMQEIAERKEWVSLWQ
jgi:peptide chain release factor 2